HLRRLVHQASAARKACSPPIEKRVMHFADSVSKAVIRHLLITRKCLAGGGIDRFDGHRLAFRSVVRGCSQASAALERIPSFAGRDLLMVDAPDSAVAVFGDKER